MDPQILNLECEALEEFRETMSALMQTLIRNLTERDLENGILTAKIRITRHITEGSNGQPVTMMKIEPDIGLKIGASGKVKCKEQNGIYLRFDGDGKAIVSTKQISLDEYIWNDSKRDVS